eukprot:scaffold5197_cov117-Isochrysis_galbana.AAC.4
MARSNYMPRQMMGWACMTLLRAGRPSKAPAYLSATTAQPAPATCSLPVAAPVLSALHHSFYYDTRNTL